jgi:hypothetical protein
MGADDRGHQRPRKSRATTPGAVLWALKKHGRFIECTLRFDPETGCEVQMRRSGNRSTVRRFDAVPTKNPVLVVSVDLIGTCR